MNLFKIGTFILCCFLSRVAVATPCEIYSGHKIKEKVCFDESIKGWISERCLRDINCHARIFFVKKQDKIVLKTGLNGQNPASLYCHQLKLEVIVLRDSQDNEQSFCSFKDNSIVDANAIERAME